MLRTWTYKQHDYICRLESASSSIILSGRDGVLIEAPEGNVEMKSAHDIIFASNKKVTISFFLPNVS
jgi:hypothetical protein